ncbi:MAG: DUF4296 domain-containing protein [Muribaculaceae bacterium]|nr:DUF4296 domain-containing protein [Muribaculaceae bacterium]
MIRIKHILIPCLTVAAIMVSSCSRRPKEVLSDKEAASLLADLHIADAYGTYEYNVGSGITSEDGDSIRKVLRQSVMKEHGVSERQLDTTLGWYGHNLDKYEEMYELVIENIAKKQKQIADMKGAEEDAMPTLWPYPTKLRLSGAKGTPYLLTFNIPGSKIPKGGRLAWEAKTLNSRQPIDIYIAAEYADGTVGYISRSLMSSERQHVTLQTDSTKQVKNVYGYLRIPQIQPLLLDSVTLRVNPLNPSTYYEINSTRLWVPKK